MASLQQIYVTSVDVIIIILCSSNILAALHKVKVALCEWNNLYNCYLDSIGVSGGFFDKEFFDHNYDVLPLCSTVLYWILANNSALNAQLSDSNYLERARQEKYLYFL